VDDQITDSSSVQRCTVAGYRAAHRDLLHFDSATKQSWLPMATHFEEFDLTEILWLTGPHEAVDLVSLTSRKIMQRLLSGRAAVILMVWLHLESLKMIERLQGKPVVMCSIMDLVHYVDIIDGRLPLAVYCLAVQIGWIPIVLTTVMVTEEARTLLTQMEEASGKIFPEFWKTKEALKK
ncbi:hypothetical protein T05_853, partial [Trichinella murrelli]